MGAYEVQDLYVDVYPMQNSDYESPFSVGIGKLLLMPLVLTEY